MTSTPVRAEPGLAENTDSREGEGDTMTDAQTPVGQGLTSAAGRRRGCHHLKGGRCLLHGEGAKKKWKPVQSRIVGPGGKVTMKYVGKRETWYECDVGPEGGNVLRQSRLSFVKTTPVIVRGVGDARGGTQNTSNSDFSSTTEGQSGASNVRTPGRK